MTYRDYLINKDLSNTLEEYARDNSLNTSLLLEELVENFLFDKGYLVVDNTISQTPEELYLERKSKFHQKNKGKMHELYFGEMYFGLFKADEIDEIINNLLDFSDEELFEMSKNNWEYSESRYKRFIRQKLDDPLLTPEEFMKHNKINERNRKDNVTFEFDEEMIASFNKSKYSKETISNAKLFLNTRSDEELHKLINDRKNSQFTSAEFVLEEMTQSEKLPYVYDNKHGGKYIYRKGHNFGTFKIEKVTEVWHFLDNVGWDIKYSSKKTGLKGKKHSAWVLSEMEKVLK